MSTNVKSSGNAKPKKKKVQNKVVFWSSECRYSVIINRVNELEWRLVDDEKYNSKANLLWIDVATIHERIKNVLPWQTINHFPGMYQIARKNRMGQNLNNMLRLFPKEYAFYPRTWILPKEMAEFRKEFDNSGNSLGNKIFIIKPDAGCQGRGIYLTKTYENVPLTENVVAQLYIKKPLLIDGFKFDLRLYCLVTSVKPLRIYLFHDGLVRMCTEAYVKPNKQNLGMSCMHLTNYAVNKHNENFLQPDAAGAGASNGDSDESGSKRSLQWFMHWVRSEHGDAKADWLWRRMGVLCTRTILSIIPIMSREYDEKFKQFQNVPIDIRKIQATSAYSTVPSASSATVTVGKAVSVGKSMKAASNRSNDDENGEQTEDEEDEEDDDDDSNSNGGGNGKTSTRTKKRSSSSDHRYSSNLFSNTSSSSKATSSSASGEKKDGGGEGEEEGSTGGPQFRGSR